MKTSIHKYYYQKDTYVYMSCTIGISIICVTLKSF